MGVDFILNYSISQQGCSDPCQSSDAASRQRHTFTRQRQVSEASVVLPGVAWLAVRATARPLRVVRRLCCGTPQSLTRPLAWGCGSQLHGGVGLGSCTLLVGVTRSRRRQRSIGEPTAIRGILHLRGVKPRATASPRTAVRSGPGSSSCDIAEATPETLSRDPNLRGGRPDAHLELRVPPAFGNPGCRSRRASLRHIIYTGL